MFDLIYKKRLWFDNIKFEIEELTSYSRGWGVFGDDEAELLLPASNCRVAGRFPCGELGDRSAWI